MIWTRSMRKLGRIQHSSCWCTTSQMHGLMSESSFHKNYMLTGTIEKTCPSKTALQPKVTEFLYLPCYKGKPYNRYTKDTKELRNVCWRPGESVFWPGISDDIRKAVERCGTCQVSSRAAKPLGNASKVPPHLWHTLGTDLFYWNKIDFLVISDYFTKFIIVRRLLNSSIHAMIKELRMVFTEFGRPFMLRSMTMDCATVPRSSSSSLSSIKCTTSWAAHIIHRAMDLLRLLWASPRSWWKKPSKMENHGTMDYYNIKLLQFPVTSHHH